MVPPLDRESGFYSRYFVVPKKDGGLRPILDLRLLNRSVSRLKFRMLTVKQVVSQIRSEDWFVTIDLKDAYFHVSILPSHRKFLRFAFSGKAYQYRVLPFGLALSPRTFTKCVDAALAPLRLQGIHILNYIDDWLIVAHSEQMAVRHRDGGSTSRCRSRSHERVGVKTKCKEKCAVSIPENHLSRRGVGFDHDAGTIVPCSDRVDSQHGQESQRRSVTHGQAVSDTAGSDGSSVQRDTFWPAVHETPTVVAQVQGVLPEGKPVPHDQGHAAMPTCLGHVEETLVLVSGPGPGSSLPPCNASDGCIPDRLGGGHEWPPCPRSVEWSPSHVAHQLPGDAGRVSSTETFSSGPKKSQCASTHRQHSCGFLYQPPGRSAFTPLMQAGAPDPCVVPGQVPLAERGLYSWASQCRSRHPVEAGAEARGMEASPRGGEADLESFWPGTGGSVCDSSDIALSPLVLSDSSSSAGAGCYGTDVAEASSVRLSPDCCAPGSSRESAPGRGPAVASSPVLAGPSMALGPEEHHVLLSILVVTSPAPDVWLSILTDYTYDLELDIADGVPLAFRRSVSFPRGTRVTYVTWDVFCHHLFMLI